MKPLGKLLYWMLAVPQSVSIWPETRLYVASGPFQGMRYVWKAYGSAHSAKLLGTYEKELHSCVEEAIAIPFERMVNVGAGEGYYAIGFALRTGDKLQVIAFEAEEGGSSLIRQLARLNSISNISIYGRCGVRDLEVATTCSGKVLVICDVEGFEAELLDPVKVPQLARSWMLVELHDFLCSGISALIRERFEKTHSIKEIKNRRRTWLDFPRRRSAAALFPQSVALRAMEEGRPAQSWFWMQPL